MKKTWCAVIALCFVISGCSPRAHEKLNAQGNSSKHQARHADVDQIHDPEERLEGTWIAIRGETQGEQTLLEGYTYSFSDGRFTSVAPHATAEGRYEIDATETPMQITFIDFGLGIFEFRGDELYLCVDSEKRPKSFTTSESSYEILTICKRGQ